MDTQQALAQAETLLKKSEYSKAGHIYGELLEDPEIGGIAAFRLGEIFNRAKDGMKSRQSHELAFKLDPYLARRILPQEHVNYSYVYNQAEEKQIPDCTLCNKPGNIYGVYNCISNADFINGFNPVRTWLHCEDCDHLWAGAYPVNLGELLTRSAPTFLLEPKVQMFIPISHSLDQVLARVPERTMLDVGCGAGEYVAVAVEMGFKVAALDLREAYAMAVHKRYGVTSCTTSFLDFSEDQRFGVVSMGDVLEHLPDKPSDIFRKLRNLLVSGGLVHISTPNFRSAYAMTKRETDPMWRVCEHLNYFSRNSLEQVMEDSGFVPVHYALSARYNGSMEVIAKLKD